MRRGQSWARRGLGGLEARASYAAAALPPCAASSSLSSTRIAHCSHHAQAGVARWVTGWALYWRWTRGLPHGHLCIWLPASTAPLLLVPGIPCTCAAWHTPGPGQRMGPSEIEKQENTHQVHQQLVLEAL